MSDKAVEAALASIEKQFGKGAISHGNRLKDIEIPRISSGSAAVDFALNGGWARGRVAEIYGMESSGKTTLALHAIAEAQSCSDTCAFIDAEHALDPTYAEAVGVCMDDLIVSQPSCGEEALQITDMLTRSGGIDLIVIDSVAALVPKAELEGDMDENQVGLQSRLMSKAMRKLVGNIQKSDTLTIFINQMRMKIGVMFGSPETTSGGNALKFYASQRVDVRRTGTIKRGDEIVGNDTKIKVVKNKVGPPFRIAEIRIMYGQGIDKQHDLIRMGVTQGIIEKKGAWYSYTDKNENNHRWQGETQGRDYLIQNPDIEYEIHRKVMGHDVLQDSEENEQQEDGSANSDQQ